MKPSWVNKLSIGFGVSRLGIYLVFFLTSSTDAQWQLGYIPLWILDFPITLIYWKLPLPIGEAFIGPAWWFLLPQLLWWPFRELSPEVKT